MGSGRAGVATDIIGLSIIFLASDAVGDPRAAEGATSRSIVINIMRRHAIETPESARPPRIAVVAVGLPARAGSASRGGVGVVGSRAGGAVYRSRTDVAVCALSDSRGAGAAGVVGLHVVVGETTVAVAGGTDRAEIAVGVGACDLGAGRPGDVLLVAECAGYASGGRIA